LAIESSGPRGSVALLDGSLVIRELCHDTANAHAETLVRLVDEILNASGWARSSLDCVAVGLGPGSFTGLRVGVALAQGIGLGLGRPVRGVSSLRALAACVRTDSGAASAAAWFGALTDARRGEFFFAAYDAELRERVAPVAIPQLGARERIEQLLPGQLGRLGGAALLPAALSPAPFPRAPHGFIECREAHLQAATASQVGQLAQSPWVETEILPLYLRDADAIIPNIVPNVLLRGALLDTEAAPSEHEPAVPQGEV
jgi:tRNA threonylcarbamoyladenosine biosynthesis protein TsaB